MTSKQFDYISVISVIRTYLECSPMVTLPITEAEGAIKLLAPGSAGATPSTETIRLDGTNRSVYFATSMLAPRLSSVALLYDNLFIVV